ncbi:MAG: MFS transporter, partial [Actinomycetota bacterium]
FQGGTFFTLMLAVPFSVPVMAVAAAILGITFSVITVVWDTLLQLLVPPDLLARVYSYDFLGSTAAIPIGTAIVGTLAARFGAREVLIGAAALQVLGGIEPLFIRGVWRIGMEKDPAPATPAA